jgi:hypothetical protein
MGYAHSRASLTTFGAGIVLCNALLSAPNVSYSRTLYAMQYKWLNIYNSGGAIISTGL